MRYFIATFGCQMNKADSERIAGAYKLKGYKKTKSIKEADVVLINTCSVRQSAEDRVFGLVNNLSKLSKKPKIILTGCMLRYTLWQLKKILPGVDKFLKIEDLIKKGPALRQDKNHAWVPIMRGCDNFCTYCVVPYSRGREQSRPREEIICEVKELVKRGYRQITLLGQNVNSYKPSFFRLLCQLHKIKGLEKIKFITSNPHDLTDDIIQAMKLPKIDRYLHLPVQSGDDRVLKKMNRKYTAKQYLELIKKIKKEIPEIEIGTDIIVGFPGETKKQFQSTLSLCKIAKFKVAYIAKYSPRPGTAAYKLKDNVPYKEKKRRWQILDNLINHDKI